MLLFWRDWGDSVIQSAESKRNHEVIRYPSLFATSKGGCLDSKIVKFDFQNFNTVVP